MNGKDLNFSFNYRKGASALTLAEVLIVVAILGILGAIVIPSFAGHIQKTKESAAKENLYILRTTFLRYTVDHEGQMPGFVNGTPMQATMIPTQLMFFTSTEGQPSNERTAVFKHGYYLKDIPKNPFNDKDTFRLILNSDSIKEIADGSYGWIYQPSTNSIAIDWPGNDSMDQPYSNY